MYNRTYLIAIYLIGSRWLSPNWPYGGQQDHNVFARAVYWRDDKIRPKTCTTNAFGLRSSTKCRDSRAQRSDGNSNSQDA